MWHFLCHNFADLLQTGKFRQCLWKAWKILKNQCAWEPIDKAIEQNQHTQFKTKECMHFLNCWLILNHKLAWPIKSTSKKLFTHWLIYFNKYIINTCIHHQYLESVGYIINDQYNDNYKDEKFKIVLLNDMSLEINQTKIGNLILLLFICIHQVLLESWTSYFFLNIPNPCKFSHDLACAVKKPVSSNLMLPNLVYKSK